MDKFLQLIEELKEKKQTLETRKDKKQEKLNNLVAENNSLIRKRRKINQKIADLYDIQEKHKELMTAMDAWAKKAPKIKKVTLAYGISIIVSVLLSIGLYYLFPELVPIIGIILTTTTAASTSIALTITLKAAIPFLITYIKNRKIVLNNDMNKIDKKIKKLYSIIDKDIDKTYERNELKIDNIAEKIEILTTAINEFENLIKDAEQERYETKYLEVDYKDYTEEQEISILNYCFNNSDEIRRIRRKEREIKNDN